MRYEFPPEIVFACFDIENAPVASNSISIYRRYILVRLVANL